MRVHAQVTVCNWLHATEWLGTWLVVLTLRFVGNNFNDGGPYPQLFIGVGIPLFFEVAVL